MQMYIGFEMYLPRNFGGLHQIKVLFHVWTQVLHMLLLENLEVISWWQLMEDSIK